MPIAVAESKHGQEFRKRVLSLTVVLWASSSVLASAETYVSGMVGYTLVQDTTRGKVVNPDEMMDQFGINVVTHLHHFVFGVGYHF
jgi:hypothetical protein